jgi:methylated-DNA-[protein]-cysteine S-methyltransferase
MLAQHFLFFDTAFGRMGLAWNAVGLTGVRLPDEREDLLRASMRRRTPGAVEWPAGDALPSFVEQAIEAIRALLSGQARDLSDLPLDLNGIGEFERRVYAAAQALAPGQTCTYGEMARAIGEPAAMRAVGQALGHNPWPVVVPCHRILAAGGKLGGFSAPGGSETKRRLLVLEAVMRRREGDLF